MTTDHQMSAVEQIFITLLFLTAYILLLPLIAVVAIIRLLPDKNISIIIRGY